jgi:hypothetical protein
VVILRYLPGSPSGGFYVTNRSEIDAINVRLKPTHSRQVLIESEAIPLLKKEDGDVPLILQTVDKESRGRRHKHAEAWRDLASDAWSVEFPISVPQSQDRIGSFSSVLNQASSDQLNNQLLIPLEVLYGDLAGRSFTSPATVGWNPIGNRICEVRLGTVERV